MLIKLAVSPFTNSTSLSFGNPLLIRFPIPLISPFAPSPKVTKLVVYGIISVRYFFSPVMCLEHPLSKYQSSFDESLKDVCAIRALTSTLDLVLQNFLLSAFLGIGLTCLTLYGYP